MLEDYKLLKMIYPGKFDGLFDTLPPPENVQLVNDTFTLTGIHARLYRELVPNANLEVKKVKNFFGFGFSITSKEATTGSAKKDSFALFRVQNGVRVDKYVGEVLFFFEQRYTEEIFAFVSWFPKPKMVDRYYAIDQGDSTETMISTSSIENSVFIVKDGDFIYGIPKKLD